MYSKVIFVIATLCVVNASVITLDAFEDDVQTLTESRSSSELRRCHPRECKERCRRLQFSGGTCVNGRCECDNFRKSEDDVHTLTESGSSPELRRCHPRECKERCRRLQFSGGACVNGRCKCSESEDFTSTIEDYLSLRSCSPQECHQRCRRLKFTGGACVNGRCKCDNFRESQVKELPTADNIIKEEAALSELPTEGEGGAVLEITALTLEPEDSQNRIRFCSSRICDRVCRLLKLKGKCENKRCKCYPNASSASGAFGIADEVEQSDEE